MRIGSIVGTNFNGTVKQNKSQTANAIYDVCGGLEDMRYGSTIENITGNINNLKHTLEANTSDDETYMIACSAINTTDKITYPELGYASIPWDVHLLNVEVYDKDCNKYSEQIQIQKDNPLHGLYKNTKKKHVSDNRYINDAFKYLKERILKGKEEADYTTDGWYFRKISDKLN